MKKYFMFFIVSILIPNSYSQQSNTLSISDLRNYVKKVEASLKSDDMTKMHISSDYNGNRWFYIKDQEINGLKSDEAYVSFEYTKLYVKMLYLAINYDLENPISLTYFPNLMLSKGIIGVQFITRNNEFFFKWDEIMNKIKSKSN